MDEVIGVMGNITRMLAIFGGGVAAITVCFAGIQFMTGSGDPQKMAQARMSLIGTLGGLILVGIAFIIPRIVSETVTEPVGGVPVVVVTGNNCDAIFRTQLVFQNSLSTTEEMNKLVIEVQSHRSECPSSLWNPGVTSGSGSRTACFGAADTDEAKVGGQFVPAGLHDGGVVEGEVRAAPGRDARNNILVYFRLAAARPNDGSICWLYRADLGVWLENYPRAS